KDVKDIIRLTEDLQRMQGLPRADRAPAREPVLRRCVQSKLSMITRPKTGARLFAIDVRRPAFANSRRGRAKSARLAGEFGAAAPAVSTLAKNLNRPPHQR